MVCPNPELLSAWVDNEVPSPWREKIGEHLEGCPACMQRADAYRRLDSALSSLDAQDPPGLDDARSRVYQRLLDNLRPASRRPHWLRRQIWLPVPVAAAAALLVTVLSLALLFSNQRNGQLQLAVRQAEQAQQLASSGFGMDSIMDYLSRQDGSVNITITLPSGSGFDRGGEPFIVREADFKPTGSGQ